MKQKIIMIAVLIIGILAFISYNHKFANTIFSVIINTAFRLLLLYFALYYLIKIREKLVLSTRQKILIWVATAFLMILLYSVKAISDSTGVRIVFGFGNEIEYGNKVTDLLVFIATYRFVIMAIVTGVSLFMTTKRAK